MIFHFDVVRLDRDNWRKTDWTLPALKAAYARIDQAAGLHGWTTSYLCNLALLHLIFSHSVDTIACILASQEKETEIRTTIGLFWRYQLSGLQSLLRP